MVERERGCGSFGGGGPPREDDPGIDVVIGGVGAVAGCSRLRRLLKRDEGENAAYRCSDGKLKGGIFVDGIMIGEILLSWKGWDLGYAGMVRMGNLRVV